MDFAMHSGKKKKGAAAGHALALSASARECWVVPGKCEGMTGLVEMEALLRFIKPQVLEKRIEKENRTL